MDGCIVSKGQDGFLYYAGYNTGSLQLTSVRVSAAGTKSTMPAGGAETSVPYSVAWALRNEGIKSAGQSPVVFRAAAPVRSVPAVEVRALVLLVEFADVKFTINGVRSYFSSLLNEKNYTAAGATGSAADYFNDNFGERHRFVFDVSPVITLLRNEEYYGGRTPSLNDANPAAMVIEACEAAAKSGVDFSLYDCDGDGYADNVAVVFAGINEAEGGDAAALWPHKGDISSRNIMYNGVKLGSYSCSSEYSGDAVNKYPASIGTFCHEYAHSWGLPDLYDVNGELEGLSNALYGVFSLMDAGNYSNGGKTPPYFTAIEREMLSLAEPEDLAAGMSYTLPPVQVNNKVYRVRSRNEGEYFLLECRTTDKWDAFIGGSGLLVYHIDKSAGVCGGIPASRRWELNVINSYAPHECAFVLAASPESASKEQLAAVFYPGSTSKTSLTASGIPGLVDWQQCALGVGLKDIRYADGAVSFNTVQELSYDGALPKATGCTVISYQHEVEMKWQTGNNPAVSGGSWRVCWGIKGTAELHSGQTEEQRYIIPDLLPGTAYEGKVYFVKENGMGEVKSFSFSTDPVSSPYPYLKMSGPYKVNDRLLLRLQNLTEEYRTITFRVNSVEQKGICYTFPAAGTYLIEVSVEYPDNSRDVISKTVTVR